MVLRVRIEVGHMIYIGEIKEEEVKFDLSGQGESLRRLCFWLEL